MADNSTPDNKQSLKDFLDARKKPAPAPEAPAEKPAPKPDRSRRPVPKRPGVLRRAAGAIAGEALRDTGHIGNQIVARIGGTHRSSYMGSSRASGTSSRGDSIKLSKAAKAPDAASIGVANDPRGIEKQVVQLDKEIRDYTRYFTGEVKSIRNDIAQVSDVANSAQRAIDQMKKDMASEVFRKRIADAKLRSDNGRFLSADQVIADPTKVRKEDESLLQQIIDDALKYGKGAAGAAAGAGALALRKKIVGVFSKRGAATAAKMAPKDVLELLAKEEVGRTVGRVAGKEAGSLIGRAAGTVVKGKGSSIGLSLDLLQAMKNDSKSGNHLRTELRSLWNSIAPKGYGIKDEGEAASWAGAMSNDEYDAAKKADAEKVQEGKQSADDNTTETDRDWKLTSKQSISITATRDVALEAKNELSIKARHISLDSEKLTITVNGREVSLNGGSGGDGVKLAPPGGGNLRGNENLSPEDQRYQDYANKMGREKADELLQMQEQNKLSPGYWIKRFTSGNSKSSDAYTTPKPDQKSPGYNATGTGYQNTPAESRTGKYRPKYELHDADLSDDVVNTVAGEGYTNNQASTDAVIHNLMNRVGTKGYGPSGDLRQVARAPGQYAGYRAANPKEAEFIRSRIKAIASGDVPDPTGGANEYRASYYNGPWARKHAEDGKVIGGNRFAYSPDVKPGPYAPYKLEEKERESQPQPDTGSGMSIPNAPRTKSGEYLSGTERLLHQSGNLSGVNPKLMSLMRSASKDLPDGFHAEIISGHDSRSTGTTNHPNGIAADIKIYDDQGKLVPYDRGGPGMQHYEQFHQSMVERGKVAYPNEKFIWGGTWQSRAAGNGDPMHMQILDRSVPGSSRSSGAYDDDKGAHGHPFERFLMSDDDRKKYKQFVRDRMADENKPQPPAPKDAVLAQSNDVDKLAQAASDKAQSLVAQKSDSDSSMGAGGKELDAMLDKASPTVPVQPLDAAPARGTDSNAATSDMAKSLGANELDASTSDADMLRNVPTPQSVSAPEDPEAGQKLTDSIAKETDSKPTQSRDQTAQAGDSGHGRASHSISAPVNHPETEDPRPGSDGYGAKATDPDDCGICSI